MNTDGNKTLSSFSCRLVSLCCQVYVCFSCSFWKLKNIFFQQKSMVKLKINLSSQCQTVRARIHACWWIPLIFFFVFFCQRWSTFESFHGTHYDSKYGWNNEKVTSGIQFCFCFVLFSIIHYLLDRPGVAFPLASTLCDWLQFHELYTFKYPWQLWSEEHEATWEMGFLAFIIFLSF